MPDIQDMPQPFFYQRPTPPNSPTSTDFSDEESSDESIHSAYSEERDADAIETPPNSPGDCLPATADIQSLIRTALEQAKRVNLSRPPLLWDQAFGLDPEGQLLSTLERLQAMAAKSSPQTQALACQPQYVRK